MFCVRSRVNKMVRTGLGSKSAPCIRLECRSTSSIPRERDDSVEGARYTHLRREDAVQRGSLDTINIQSLPISPNKCSSKL